MLSAMSPEVMAALPLACVIGFALLVLILDLFARSDRYEEDYRSFILAVGCLYAWLFSFLGQLSGSASTDGFLEADAYGFVLVSIILCAGVLTLFFHHRYLGAQRVKGGVDIDVLVMCAVAGGMVMVSTANLMVLFIGFELLSLSLYALTGTARSERASAEGALRYFILGAFSSAFLLYGIALIYGGSGSLDLAVIRRASYYDNTLLLMGLAFLFFGFAFKASLVPFHFWTPDVYHGAPVSIAGFMSAAVKAASLGALLRVLVVGFPGMSDVWSGALWLMAVLSMTLGNVAALQQTSIKRLLAYSSIAHAGYVVIGFLSGPAGYAASIFYLMVYALMTLLVFGVVLVVTAGSPAQYEKDDIVSLSGLGWTHPFIGMVMVIGLLSLAGMPPLAGFTAKFSLFVAAVRSGHLWLVVIAVLNSLLSLTYYLRIVVVMYLTGERRLSWSPPRLLPFVSALALTIAACGLVYLGLFAEESLRYFSIVAAALH